jgi:predicted nucleotidyltransferase
MITEKQITHLVDLIVNDINPKKILLFGSYASGKYTIHSDVDLIVIVDENLEKKERRKKICRLNILTATPELMFPKDIFLYSESEYKNLKNNSQSFLFGALQQSKNLYDR